MKTKLIFSIICFTYSLTTINAQNNWIERSNFGGSERYSTISFSIGSKGYVGTGTPMGHIGLDDFWEWDKNTNAWKKKANFPGGLRHDAVGFSIGKKGYIGTGTDMAGTDMFQDLWEWDQTTDVWTKKADFPGEKRRLAVGFSIGSKGYIALGTDASLTTFYNDLWEYNPTADTIAGSPWTQKASFPGTGRAAAFCFTIGTKAFIGTGTDFIVDFKDFKEWDPTTNRWTSKADFGGGERHSAVGFSIGNKGYAGLGHPVAAADFREYDPIADVWTLKANYQGDGKVSLASFSIDNKGYIGLGCDPSVIPAIAYNDFWEYNPLTTGAIDLNNALKILLYPNPTNNKFTISTQLLNWNFVIYNLQGENVYTSTINAATTEVDLSKEAKGIYFIKLQRENDVLTHKIIVQ